jgi:hypothetical protein
MLLVLPSENQDQIAKFLATDIGKSSTSSKIKKILASESGFDGFYMALLKEILKPKEIKAEIEPAGARIITITVYTQNVFNLKAFFIKHNLSKMRIF